MLIKNRGFYDAFRHHKDEFATATRSRFSLKLDCDITFLAQFCMIDMGYFTPHIYS